MTKKNKQTFYAEAVTEMSTKRQNNTARDVQSNNGRSGGEVGISQLGFGLLKPSHNHSPLKYYQIEAIDLTASGQTYRQQAIKQRS